MLTKLVAFCHHLQQHTQLILIKLIKQIYLLVVYSQLVQLEQCWKMMF